MQVYGERTSTESSSEQWSRTGGDPGHLGRVDDTSHSEPRPWRRLHMSLRRLVNRLLRIPAERTSRPHVCYLCLLSVLD